MPLLPQELRRPQEHSRAQLPTQHIRPLIEQHGQVAIAFDPLGEKMSDDGFRSRTNDVRFLQHFSAGNRDNRQLGRETFPMLGLFLEKTLRNEQRKINVLVAGGLEAVVEFTLEPLPDSVAVRLDDHAAFDNLCRFGHVALQHDVLIPRSKVFPTRSNWGFCHCSLFFLDLPGSQSHPEPGCVTRNRRNNYLNLWLPCRPNCETG